MLKPDKFFFMLSNQWMKLTAEALIFISIISFMEYF